MFARILALVAVVGGAAVAPAAVIISVVNVNPTATNGGTVQPAVQQTPAQGTLPFTQNTAGPTNVPNPAVTTPVPLFAYVPGAPTVTSPGNIVNATVKNYDLSIAVQDPVLGNLGTIDLGGSGVGGYNDAAGRTFINDSFDSSNGGFLRVNGQSTPFLTEFPSDPNAPVAQVSIPYGAGFLNFALYDPNAAAENNAAPGLEFDVFSSAAVPNGFTLIRTAPTPQRQPAGGGNAVVAPEPASVAVFGLGVAAAGWVGRRRTRVAG